MLTPLTASGGGAPAAYPGARPAFIAGCVRSGTSAIAAALREGAGFRGHQEGGVSPLLFKLHQAADRHYDALPKDYRESPAHMIGAIGRDGLKARISGVMGALLHGAMGDGRWLDKTPSGADMVRSCPLLLELFPQARFIFCKRRAIENILSRQRKFPDAPFANACRHWADTMHAWLETRSRLQGRYIELDQRDMAVFPAQAAKSAGALLQLTAGEVRAVEHSLRTRRVEQTRAAADRRYLGLDETGWTDEEKRQFTAICLPMMTAYGYAPEGGEEAAAQPIGLFYPLETGAGAIERHNVRLEERGFSAVGPDMLQLHPNRPGEGAAEIRYLNLPLSGHSRFSAQLLLGSDASQPVAYGLRVEESAGRREVAAAKQVVAAGAGPVDWTVELPVLRGAYDIVISTEMAEGSTSSECAWARWKKARVA